MSSKRISSSVIGLTLISSGPGLNPPELDVLVQLTRASQDFGHVTDEHYTELHQPRCLRNGLAARGSDWLDAAGPLCALPALSSSEPRSRSPARPERRSDGRARLGRTL